MQACKNYSLRFPYEILVISPSREQHILEEIIMQRVIRTRVYKDTNIFGGKLKQIVLLTKLQRTVRMDSG